MSENQDNTSEVGPEEWSEREGYVAGMKAPKAVHCPFDGRTKNGRAWWKGFLRGDRDRISAKVAS